MAAPAAPDSTKLQFELLFQANIRCEAEGRVVNVELSNGGGADPAIIGSPASDATATDANKIWEFFAIPGKETQVLIRNPTSGRHIISDGLPGKRLRAEQGNIYEKNAHWYVEGVDLKKFVAREQRVVRLRNVYYTEAFIDLSAGGTAFQTYIANNLPNQSFKIWRTDLS